MLRREADFVGHRNAWVIWLITCKASTGQQVKLTLCTMNPPTSFHNLGRLMTWVATVLTRFSSQTALDASPKTSFTVSFMGWGVGVTSEIRTWVPSSCYLDLCLYARRNPMRKHLLPCSQQKRGEGFDMFEISSGHALQGVLCQTPRSALRGHCATQT